MLLTVLLVSLGINFALFLPAYFFQTDKLTDLSYSLSFIALSSFAFVSEGSGLVDQLILLMVLIWALRIGGYLFVRIHKMKRDARFDSMRKKLTSFGGFWLLQAVTAWVVLIPSVMVMAKDLNFKWFSIVGLLLWALGVLIESVADLQKYRFKALKNPPQAWIQSGLWKHSRHPNYFGEILLWFGVYVFCLPYLAGLEIFIGLLSPVFIGLMLMYVSGIPLLEKKADSKYGKDPKYLEYKQKTPVLVPKL